MTLQPKNVHYIVRVAEIYYSMKDFESMISARGYFALALNTDIRNARAAWGLYHTCKSLSEIRKVDSKNSTLLNLSKKTLLQLYSSKGTFSLLGKIEL